MMIRKNKLLILFHFILMLTSSCSPSQPSSTPTPTEEPAATSTPAPTATNTPKPTYTLSGTIFFDFNGSGLQDVAYDMNGEAVEEPAIPDIPVCLDHNPYEDGIDEENCIFSNEDGSYSFTDLKNGSHTLYVVSPSDEPAEAFRYVNVWKREVTIDEYTKDIDTATMDSLEAIKACETDSETLVCKYDEDTLLVREQHLNDTEVKLIEDGIDIRINGDNEENIAVMQGFLTLPFNAEDFDQLSALYCFDHNGGVGNRTCYDGDSSLVYDDGHVGIDYGLPNGTILVASTEGKIDHWTSTTYNGSSNNISVTTGLPSKNGEHKPTSVFGHVALFLAEKDEKVYRGQIIALSGISGTAWYHLHFDFLFGPANPIQPDDYIPGGYQKDPYGVEEGVPYNFEFEKAGFWILRNEPFFN